MKDIYMKFTPEIKGESQDNAHSGWIEIESWNQSIDQPRALSASTSGGLTSERCTHDPMRFSKIVDKVSPSLYQNCSCGQTFSEVQIDFMRADGKDDRVKYLQIKLKDVMINSISTSVGSGDLPYDNFSLTYGAVEWKYTQQKIGGNANGSTVGQWSLIKNKITYDAN
jgi:type VI secretion system secreted protein Hcp